MAVQLAEEVEAILHSGTVIPALPLALTRDRKFDERHQRALCRYYTAAGAGGLAAGVHSTQFAIRDPKIGLFEPVLELAMEELREAERWSPLCKIAGICGPTEQAVREARIASDLGYDLGLLSMGGLGDWDEEQLLERARIVGEVIPLFGFYLQPKVGGRVLSYGFWRKFADIPQVHAIKIAPFDRYLTLDVVRAVCHSGRGDSIALYTGNDDNIVADLLTEYAWEQGNQRVSRRMSGGLLGQWAVWTRRAVELLEEIQSVRSQGVIPSALLQAGAALTDANAAVFDAANGFAGCIPGINEVLRRQGLLSSNACLDPQEVLSPGQAEEIDRVIDTHPRLTDDDFVQENLDKWLA